MRKTKTDKKKSKIISIRLPAATSARVTRLASERKQTVSEVIRAALDDFQPQSNSPFLRFSGIVDSGVSDLSTNPKHLKGFGK